MTLCPRCSGSQLAGHPAGWLAWQHRATCELLAAEDATRAADYSRVCDHGRGTFERPLTPTERTLLVALGHDLPKKLTTTVTPLLPSVIHRSWPLLEDDED